jgi:hypothetical protein
MRSQNYIDSPRRGEPGDDEPVEPNGDEGDDDDGTIWPGPGDEPDLRGA